MDLETWKKSAKASQQNYSNLFNDRVWEKYELPEEKQLLTDKIAFAFCGGFKEKYTKEDTRIIDEVLCKCVKLSQKSERVHIAFLFICAYNQRSSEEIQVPLVRIMKNDGKVSQQSYFVDHVRRVYTNWSTFLKENAFDLWWICAPKNGLYSYVDEVEIEFYDQTSRGRIVHKIDKISTFSNVGTSLSMIAGTIMTFTPLAPVGLLIVSASAIAGAPGAIYGTGRSISKLVDRGQHDQSVSLRNAEARSCWISTVAGVLSFGSMSATTLLARTAASGKIVTASVRTFCTSLNVTAISMNGVGILNSVVDVAKKSPDDITALDILQLTTSIFFFTNSLVSFKTANQLVKDAQKSRINSMRNNLPEESQQAFDNVLRNTKRQSGQMHGSADFIRAVKQIDSKQEFFKALGIDTTLKANFDRKGMINIKGANSKINPNSFMEMSITQRVEMIKQSTFSIDVTKVPLPNQKKKSALTNTPAKSEQRSSNSQKKALFDNRLCRTACANVALQVAGSDTADKWLSTGLSLAKVVARNNLGECCDATAAVLQQLIKELHFHTENPVRDVESAQHLYRILQMANEHLSEKWLVATIQFAKSLACNNVSVFFDALEFVVHEMMLKLEAFIDDPSREPLDAQWLSKLMKIVNKYLNNKWLSIAFKFAKEVANKQVKDFSDAFEFFSRQVINELRVQGDTTGRREASAEADWLCQVKQTAGTFLNEEWLRIGFMFAKSIAFQSKHQFYAALQMFIEHLIKELTSNINNTIEPKRTDSFCFDDDNSSNLNSWRST